MTPDQAPRPERGRLTYTDVAEIVGFVAVTAGAVEDTLHDHQPVTALGYAGAAVLLGWDLIRRNRGIRF